MAPGSIFHHINLPSTIYLYFTFTLQSLLSIYITKIPKIFILLSLSDLTFASGREGIDNPFIALVARFLFVCVGTRDSRVVSYWIDTLVLKNWGKYLRYYAASPFPLRGTTTQAREVARRISSAVAGEAYAKVIYQVPITNPYSSHYIFASRFPLPHFTLAVLFALLMPCVYRSLASHLLVCYVPSMCLHLCLLKIYCYGSP